MVVPPEGEKDGKIVGMDTLRFPIQFQNGGVKKVTESTDEYFAQILALSIQILPGELPLTPTYGIEDPTFQATLTRDLAFTAGAFIPEIIINRVQLQQNETGQVEIGLSFLQRTQ
jgi:hypothetical protein